MMDKVVDNVTHDVKSSVKDILLQREQDRKEKIKSLKEDKELSVSDQVKLFDESFDEYSQKIMKSLSEIEEKKIEQKDLPELFGKISKDLQILNRYLSVSTVFLTNYCVRKRLQTIEELENKVKSLETEFLPKKKFGFRSRKASKVSEKPSKILDEVDTTTSEKIIRFETVSCGFSDKNNENLKLINKVISKNDVELRNLQNCTVFLHGSPGTVHISNLTQCKILCGPVSSSVFVENCNECDFVVACQQLRIHSTKSSNFYIHVTSRAIIEDSSDVQFAPYNLTYEGIEEDFDSSGLERSQNNWNQVDDFNWLASDVPSPNWKEMNEDERVQSWPL